MRSKSKREKGIDRISNLPNSLISHILSFLSTKDAVRTSVLSIQWIHQWTTITHLDIDDGYYPPCRRENSCDTTTTQSNFVHFVYRVLLFKVTRLDSFKLKCGRDYGGVIHIHSWLSAARSRHVGEIDLTIPKSGIHLSTPPWSPLKLDGLFSSTTLVVLKLGRGFLLRVPDIISLESLEVLHLNTVAFEDNESLPRLVSSCPRLEELKMQGTFSERREVDVLHISSQVLKRLILDGFFYPYSHNLVLDSYDLVLDTPSLEYLEHKDLCVPESYYVEMKTLHCLDKADLCLRLSSEQFDRYEHKLILAESMAELALAISNVQFLHLSVFAFEALNHPDCVMPNFELPKFPRLTELKINYIHDNVGLSLLVAFLQVSPQLASLSFALDPEHLDDVWNTPTDVPFCMQHNLEVIEFTGLSGVPLEYDMIKYFLEKTISLKELILPKVKTYGREELYPWKRDAEELINKAFMLPKASK